MTPMLSLSEIHEIVEIAVDRSLEPLDWDTNFYADLAMDSIGAVALVVEVQRRIGVRIPDDLIPDLQSPRLLLNAISDLAVTTRMRAVGDDH